jgi:hypothetical protein
MCVCVCVCVYACVCVGGCCGNLKLRYGTLRQFSRKQRFILLAQTQRTCVQRLSPENKGVSPFANRLQKQKARFNPYMTACDSIGYFTPSAT